MIWMALVEVLRQRRLQTGARDPSRAAPGADCPPAHRVGWKSRGGSGGCPASTISLEMLSIFVTAPTVWGVTRLTTRRE